MMNFRTLISVPALLLVTLAQAGAQNGNYVLGVKTADLPSVAQTHHLTVLNDIDDSGGSYLVQLAPGADPNTQTASLVADPAVTSVEADRSVSSTGQSAALKAVIAQLTDALAASSIVPFYGGQVRSAYLEQTASKILELNAARQITTGGGVVAVIDTGVDPSHPALAGALVAGYDFTRNEATIPDEMADLDPVTFSALTNSSQVPEENKTQPVQLQGSTVAILDQSTVAILDGASLPVAFGHGTMIAGLIHLVAPTASIMPLKAFKSDGSANLSDIVRAIYFAVNHGARVINMSFDLETPSVQLQNAISYATSHGVICVAAAGNDGKQETVYPATLPKVIGVGSTSNSDQRSSFSNFGTSSVFMAAPGEGLITTFPGSNYAGVWGTSFSTALVSGTVASLLQLDPGLGYCDAAEALSAGVQIPSQKVGRDRLDVLMTLQSLLGQD
jgi:subtilisin family serine protease